MVRETIEVIEPGLLTTVQDLGRYGCQRYGVPVSGAMDAFSLRAANILVGNEQGAACLEMTVLGPRIRFLRNTLVALTGGDLAVRIDGTTLPRWRSVTVRGGSVLTSDSMVDGMRAYLAVAGGLDVPVIMGSRSTYIASGIGGHEGRALRAGDVLAAGPPDPGRHTVRALPTGLEPLRYGHSHVIRAMAGPQADAFAPGALETFFDSRYSVTIDSDRVGYRLSGPRLAHLAGADIISDGSPAGAIQVPASGMPIVLMADRGPTGGYAKLGTVISADLGRLAQARPGDAVSFRQVSADEALAALGEQEEILHSMDPDLRWRAPRQLVRSGGRTRPPAPPSRRGTAPAAGFQRTAVARATIGGETLEVEIMIGPG